VDEQQGLYTFRRADGSGFGGSGITEGEMVVLSMEGEKAKGKARVGKKGSTSAWRGSWGRTDN
jgi:hypothetical protein